MASAAVTRSIAECAALLRAGGIVAYPTETFYGLGALATHREALARLAAAKLRPIGKPLPLLAADREQVDAVARVEGLAARLAERFWPGPLTLVLAAQEGLDDAITAGSGTVAIRIPGSDIARQLARESGGALVSTSANLSGGRPPEGPADLDADLLSRIDAVLEAPPCPGGLPSTIVAFDASGATLVRAGAIPWTDVEAALRG